MFYDVTFQTEVMTTYSRSGLLNYKTNLRCQKP